MSFRQAIDIGRALVQVHLLRRRVPLFAAWNLTFRCNLHCAYCGTNEVAVAELDGDAVCQRLGELWGLGTRWITFGGGEPLVRPDAAAVFRHAKRLGMTVYLSTNGSLVAEKREALAWVDHVNLSLDGPREIHDLIRGPGTYDLAVEAAAVLRAANVPASLLCVLSQHNLACAETLISLAAEWRLPVMFQPADRLLNTSGGDNAISPLVAEYRATVARLIEQKRQGAPIRNSLTGLKHLARWPEPGRPWCPAGVLVAVIQPNGELVGCHLSRPRALLSGPLDRRGLGAQWSSLAPPRLCNECWCAPLVELSLACSFRPEAMWNAWRFDGRSPRKVLSFFR